MSCCSPLASMNAQIYLSAVTMVLPKREWIILYYAAARGAAWKQGAGAGEPLLQGMSTLAVGAGGATPAGVHLDALGGWDINATNLWLVSDSAVTAAELPPEVGVGAPRPGGNGGTTGLTLNNSTSSGDSGGDSKNGGIIAGAVVGGVCGAALLGVGAFVLVGRSRYVGCLQLRLPACLHTCTVRRPYMSSEIPCKWFNIPCTSLIVHAKVARGCICFVCVPICMRRHQRQVSRDSDDALPVGNGKKPPENGSQDLADGDRSMEHFTDAFRGTGKSLPPHANPLNLAALAYVSQARCV